MTDFFCVLRDSFASFAYGCWVFRSAGRIECGGGVFRFALPQRERLLLTRDVDWIGATLARRSLIEAFEARHLRRRPWLDKVLDR